MAFSSGAIGAMRSEIDESSDPSATTRLIAQSALERSNGNLSRNTYLWQNAAGTLAEAERTAALLDGAPNSEQRSPLLGIPVSVKDCFDLAGSPTSCGTRFYRDRNGIATGDSWLVARLRAAGAVLTGKTHLHPLAYGITGENPDFGDCLQPGDPTSLTGGSSSGAAASVLEGSAMAAIGTDTGGSIRVPAALCGLAGYRASLELSDWSGAAHLAPSFDTMGWLFPDLEDAPLLGELFLGHVFRNPILPTGFAIPESPFFHDCEPTVLESLEATKAELESLGLKAATFDAGWWSDAMEIFAPIQASEAAQIHRGNFDAFEPSIRQRLEWGNSLSAAEIAALRNRLAAFQHRMNILLTEHQLLLLPAAPVTRLAAGADHSQTRTRLLRYTTPISLAGIPAVTIPCLSNGQKAGGMQLAAAHQDDSRLLVLAAKVGSLRKSTGKSIA